MLKSQRIAARIGFQNNTNNYHFQPEAASWLVLSNMAQQHNSQRRQLLAALAAGAVIGPMLACSHRTTGPLVLAAARAGNQPLLCALSSDGSLRWRIDVSERGHDIAVHPSEPLAAFVSRRPGKQVWMVDTESGRIVSRLAVPLRTQFNGHAVFTADGTRLLTTETSYPGNVGQIGIYDTVSGERLGEFLSGGLDPHQCVLANNEMLIVANGGRLEAEHGKARTMLRDRPSSISWININSGQLAASRSLAADELSLSLRHLAVVNDQTVAVGLQREASADAEGKTLSAPLIRLASIDSAWQPLAPPTGGWGIANGYIGSLAANAATAEIAATSPRGGCQMHWSLINGEFLRTEQARDISGIAASSSGFVSTSGSGAVLGLETKPMANPNRIKVANIEFDNHCAVIT